MRFTREMLIHKLRGKQNVHNTHSDKVHYMPANKRKKTNTHTQDSCFVVNASGWFGTRSYICFFKKRSESSKWVITWSYQPNTSSVSTDNRASFQVSKDRDIIDRLRGNLVLGFISTLKIDVLRWSVA